MPGLTDEQVWERAAQLKIVIVAGYKGPTPYERELANSKTDMDFMFSSKQYAVGFFPWEIERELPKEYDNTYLACQLEVCGFASMPKFAVCRCQQAPTAIEAVRRLVESIVG